MPIGILMTAPKGKKEIPVAAPEEIRSRAMLTHTVIDPNIRDRNRNPIIYLHTVGHAKEMWPSEEILMIAERTRRSSYAMDLRCHGESPHFPDFDPDLIVEDLLIFMDSKSFAKAVLVGHGLGGVVVSLFALRHPRRVEMMVNIEGALKDSVLRETNRLSFRFIRLWAISVRSASGMMLEEEVVKQAYEDVYEELELAAGAEDKEMFYRFKHPIRRVGSGYDVKHDVDVISAYLHRSARGEEELNLNGRFDGPALFMMASRSSAKENLEEIVQNRFLRPSIDVLDATHHIHLLFPRLFVDTFLDFYNNA